MPPSLQRLELNQPGLRRSQAQRFGFATQPSVPALKTSRRDDPTEAPVALLEILHRPGEVRGAEVRPHHGREAQFRVGTFPEQEIAEALFAAGADQQIDVRHVRGPATAAADALAATRSRVTRPSRLLASGRLGDGVAGGVVDGQTQVEPATRSGRLLGRLDVARPVAPSRSRRPITLSRTPASASARRSRTRYD